MQIKIMVNPALKNANLKTTTPRLKILQLLEQENYKHLSAEEIQTQLRLENYDISLATIYRALGQFETAGIVIKHNFSNDVSVFELNKGNHHDHLICVKCNLVIEFVDQIIERQQCKIAQQHSFVMTDHNLNIFGLCEHCNEDSE